MTQTKHTAGKWEVDIFNYADGRKELSICNEKFRLAKIDCDYTNENPYTIQQKEAEANANLIASAPELLEALKEAKTFLELLYEKPELIESQTAEETVFLIKEALSKAEGQQ